MGLLAGAYDVPGRPRAAPPLLRATSDASVSEVLATVLLTAMTLVLLAGFGLTVLATVDEEASSPTASFSLAGGIGDTEVRATLVSGSTLDLSATRILVLANATDATASAPTSGSWAAGESIVIGLTAPLEPDARVTLLVVNAEANAAIGRTTRTLITESTRPAYLGNALNATARVDPVPVTADGRTLANLTVTVGSTFGRDLVTAVTANLTRVGGVGELPLRDDGQGADLVASDGVWSGQFTVASYDFLTSTVSERVALPVAVRDVLGGSHAAQADLWLRPAPLSKVVSGAIFQTIPGSGAISYLNFTNFTFRDASLLDDDLMELRVSDLKDTTKSWTALVRLASNAPGCPGQPVIQSVTLTRDDLPGANATLTPTTCFVIGSGASLNLVAFSDSRDANQPPNVVSWSGDAGAYAFREAGIGEPNEGIVTFMGDSQSFGTSRMGIGQANLTWGRLMPLGDAVAPGAPTLGTPTRGDGSLTLSWTAPTSDGGTPITGYRVYMGTTSGALTLLDQIGTNTSYVAAGLANGVTYHFHVTALNAVGEGIPSAERSASPAAAPGVPQDFEVARGDAFVNLTWSAPASDGGFPITSYKVYRGTTNGSFVLLGSTSQPWFNDTAVTNGVRYHYQVSAATAAAEGDPTAVKDAMPSGLPAAPASLVATRGNQSVSLSWTAPASNGEPITSYKVYRGTSAGATTYLASVAANAFTDAGLSNGQAYHYNVTAVNAVGEGPSSGEAPATPGDRPAPPGDLGATPGDAKVTLSWTVPADNGYPITGYRVHRGTTSGATTVIATTSNPSNTSFVANDLTNGQQYFFNVTAFNALGESATSGEVGATPTAAATVPGAPQSFVVTPGDAQASLSWAAPASDGGSTILSYRIYRGTSPGSLTLLDTVPATETTYVSTGLTNGVTYYFQLSAVNFVGEGPRTSEKSAAPATGPGAPAITAATAGNRSVSLSWSAPASDGGAPVTGYTVHYGTTSPPTTNFTFTTSLSATVTGLTNGQQYHFAVSASNSAGEGAKSASVARTPLAPPNPPGGLQVTSEGNRSVSLSWSAPADAGGSAVTGYVVYHGTTSPPTTNFTFTTSLSATVTGLTNGQQYHFAVSAVNAAGEGSKSGSVTGTPRSVPFPPGNVQVTGTGNRSVSLSWSAPSDTGGSAVTGYTVYHGTTNPPTTNFTFTTSLSATVTGLTNGQQYYFTVSASNANGEGSGSASVAGTPLAAPNPPEGLQVTSTGNRSVSLSWSAPSDTGGASVTAYTVYYGTTNPPGTVFTTTGGTTATVTGLTNGQQYHFAVSATNSVGEGSKSGSVTGTPLAAPNPPGNVQVTGTGNRSVSLSWSAPSDAGGSAVTGYVVYHGTTSPPTTNFTFTTSLSATVTGLTNGQQYHFAVSAVNAAGEGSKSASVTGTPLAPPNPPESLQVASTGNRSVSLSWSAPSDTGGASVTGYTVYYGTTSPPTSVFGTTAGTTSTVTGLTNGQQYFFAVSATNAKGEGSKSASVTGTPLAVPDPPSGLAATAGNAQVALSWSAPADDGGSTVTSYKVYYGTTSPPTTLWTTTTGTTSTVTGLTNGQLYHFAVSAVSSVGEGSKGSAVSATPQADAAVEVDCGTMSTTQGEISSCSALQFADLTYATFTESTGSVKIFEATFTLNVTGVTGAKALEVNGYRGNAPEDLHVQAWNATSGSWNTITTLTAATTSATTFSGNVFSSHHFASGALTIRLIDPNTLSGGADNGRSSWNIDYVRLML